MCDTSGMAWKIERGKVILPRDSEVSLSLKVGEGYDADAVPAPVTNRCHTP